jgi:hypothetical protein
MRKLIGYLAARNGAEGAVVRVADGIFRTENILTDSALTGSVRVGSRIAITCAGENFALGATADTAGAIAGFSVFDCGIRSGQAASEGARRI